MRPTSIANTIPPAHNALLWRVVMLAGLCFVECVAFGPRLAQSSSQASVVLEFLLIAGAIFLAFGTIAYPAAFLDLRRDAARSPIRWTLLAAHGASLASLLALSDDRLMQPRSITLGALAMTAWYALGLATILFAVLAVAPYRICKHLLDSTRRLWMWSALAGTAACALMTPGDWFWKIESKAWEAIMGSTFFLVRMLLHPVLPEIPVTAAARSVGTERFTVFITDGCSGIDGLTLMLGFGLCWLFYFRTELRFPLALAMLPVSLSLVFFLNSVRIAALVAIGHFGYPEIAIRGFHAHAGWIFFSAVAVGFSYAGSQAWVRKDVASAATATTVNPTAAYLVPFLAILAASLVSRASSSGFEWSYPLRFAAGLAAIWYFRREYAKLDWRFDWFAIAAGGAVFAMWIVLDRAAPDSTIPSGLATLTPAARYSWIAIRALAASSTVPLAEELAFRGYLLRRLQRAEFETIPWLAWTPLALAASSLIFGAMHGGRWIAGSVAGLLYAVAMLRRGRLTDAVVAHATTNALLAAWVLSRGAWQLW